MVAGVGLVLMSGGEYAALTLSLSIVKRVHLRNVLGVTGLTSWPVISKHGIFLVSVENQQ